MRLLRIDHVSLNSGDRPRSIAFYQDVLGLEPSWAPGPLDEPVFMGTADARIGLFGDGQVRLRHVALATDEAGQREVRERLDGLAIPYRSERHRDHDSLYVRDPDGFVVEVMLPTA
jgi:catechol 2,3-dioxygenase-like lactoylglutathione lyase family enzyme